MTISNKYDAGFCVLTIAVVGYANVVWIAKKMVESGFLIDFQESMGMIGLKFGHVCVNEPSYSSLKLEGDNCQWNLIGSGTEQR